MDADDLAQAVARLTIFTARRDAMREAVRHHRAEPGEPNSPLVFHISEEDADAIDVILAALAEAQETQETQAAILRAFVERVCARAEADMLGGSPLEGAHYRAMQEELRLMEAAGEAQP